MSPLAVLMCQQTLQQVQHLTSLSWIKCPWWPTAKDQINSLLQNFVLEIADESERRTSFKVITSSADILYYTCTSPNTVKHVDSSCVASTWKRHFTKESCYSTVWRSRICIWYELAHLWHEAMQLLYSDLRAVPWDLCKLWFFLHHQIQCTL